MGIEILPHVWYDETQLRVHGIDGDALADARRRDGLPCRDLGRGTRLYLGSELLAWFERRRRPEREKAS